jgi:hypothetical protein
MGIELKVQIILIADNNASPFRKGIDARHQFHWIYRFGEVNVSSAVVAFDLVANVGTGSGDDDAHMGLDTAKTFDDIEPIGIGQIEVNDVNVWTEVTRFVQNFIGQRCAPHVMSLALKKSEPPFAQVVIVFQKQNFEGT